MSVDHHLGYRTAKTTESGVFLAGDDCAGFARGFQDRILVNRANAGHVHHSSRNAALFKQGGRDHCAMGQDAVRDDCHILTLAQRVGFAQFEDMAFGQQVGHADAAEAQVAAAIMFGRPFHRRRSLDPVRWSNDRHIRQGADPGEILDRMVGGAKFAIGHAGTDSNQLHIGLRIGHVRLDLFQRASGQEGGGGADEGDLATIGQARADADHVLFGDAYIDQTPGEFFTKSPKLGRTDRVIADSDDIAVRGCQFFKHAREGIAAIVKSCGVKGHVHCAASSSSAMACLYCSSLGTL